MWDFLFGQKITTTRTTTVRTRTVTTVKKPEAKGTKHFRITK